MSGDRKILHDMGNPRMADHLFCSDSFFTTTPMFKKSLDVK